MSSLDNPSHQHEIDALIKDLSINKPQDVIQYCANYFNAKLANERTSTRTSNMTDTAGLSPFDRNRGQNTIQEEEEDRDTFGSPTQPTFASSSPFSNSSPFGAAGAGGSSGLFGNWMGSSGGQEDADAAKHTPANFPGAGRRTSVSAEAMKPDADSGNWKAPRHEKTPDQMTRLKKAVSENFLFTSLDEDSSELVLGALSEFPTFPNFRVINQGDEDADAFYVVESGSYDIFIHSSGRPDGNDLGNKVATVGSGGSKLLIDYKI